MSNIRTITDIQQEEVSVHSIVLRGNPTEEVSTQTNVVDDIPVLSNLNESLREVASRSLESGEYNLPLRPSINGNTIEDSHEIRGLNSNLSEDTRQGILQSVVDDRYSEGLMRTLITNMSPETISSLRSVLVGPLNNLETYTPFLNILMYGNVGINDFNTAIVNISNLIAELDICTEQVPDVEETIAVVENRVQAANEESIERAEEANSRRSNMLSTLNWRTLLTRGSAFLTAGFAIYMGSPQLGWLANIGIRMLENNVNDFQRTGSTNIPRISQGNESWSDVSESFWNSWALFARYMSRRD